MRWRLSQEDLSPEVIYIKGSTNIVADALSRLDIIENLNNTNFNNNKVEPALERLSENFALNKEDVLHLTNFKTIMRFQQKDKSLIVIAKEKPKDYSINQFLGAGRKYSLICRYGKILIPKQIQKTLVEWYHSV